MLFNSAQFLCVFFPLVTAAYFLLGQNARLWLLFLASCVFYMAFVPKYIVILFGLIAFDFAAGLLIERATGRRRALYLTASLCANVAVLAVFKYFNFVNENLASLCRVLGLRWSIADLSLILPIGLSFHTFQSMSYTIEVYRGKQRAERSIGVYALYVLFYPQLVAGPIERPQNLLHQLHARHAFDYDRVLGGLRLMLWGLFKKSFVADRLALLVDPIYNDPAAHAGWSAPYWIATYAFAYQVYCDFSGYSDMARGAARVMGYELMENFKYPFSSKTIGEFWQRWHVSLSTWFKDYIYMPLALRALRRGKTRERDLYPALILVFLISGFWHGAGWSYGLFGLCHGVYLVCGGALKPLRARLGTAIGLDRHPRLLHALRVGATFHLVLFTWVLFRARTLHEAALVFRNLFAAPLDLARTAHVYAHHGDLWSALLGVALLILLERLERTGRLDGPLPFVPTTGRRHLWAALLLLLLLLGAPLGERTFIYFQF